MGESSPGKGAGKKGYYRGSLTGSQTYGQDMTRNEKSVIKMKKRPEREPQHLVVWRKIKKPYFTGETFRISFLSAYGGNAGKI